MLMNGVEKFTLLNAMTACHDSPTTSVTICLS